MKARELVLNLLFWLSVLGGVALLREVCDWSLLIAVPVALLGAAILTFVWAYVAARLSSPRAPG